MLTRIAKKIGYIPRFAEVPLPGRATMLFGIGAQKAGTSWLHRYLAQSDDVHFSHQKEVHYFDVKIGGNPETLKQREDALARVTAKLETARPEEVEKLTAQRTRLRALLDIYGPTGSGDARHDAYLQYMLAGWRGQKIIGDITPSYATLDAWNLADMASIGTARFVFVLRDPVHRLWSQMRMAAQVKLGRTTVDPEQLTALTRAHLDDVLATYRMNQILRSNYTRTLRALEKVVPPERRLVLFYETLFTTEATQTLCQFLDIAPLPLNMARVGEGRSAPLPDDLKSRLRKALEPQYTGIRAQFGDAVPDAWLP